MDSASIQFILFGLAAAIASNFSRSRIWRSAVLMVASFVFLGLLAPSVIILLPLAGFLLLGYFCLVALERGWSKRVVWSVFLIVLAYVWLKKYTFLPAGTFLHFPYFTLGLSYIFFRVLHLIIETGDRDPADLKPRISIDQYVLYTINFTTFVSGPIQNYDEFARDQFTTQPIALGPRVIGLQVERLIRGFFKVNVLAMLLHAVQDDAITQLYQPLPPAQKLYAAFKVAAVYPIFLYANFSGYIDIVIALARLMRVRLPENFDRPFSAGNVMEFWNRWHMTLSSWFKKYVYNPLLLALMRRISSIALEPYIGVFCFFVTFFLVGIWHGRTSEFVIFGLLTGGGVSFNKLWQLRLQKTLGRKGYKELARNSIYLSFGRGLNYTWFAFTLFWFWNDWKSLDRVYSAIGAAQWVAVWLAVWLAATAFLALWEWLRALILSVQTSGEPVFTNRYALTVYASALFLIAVFITILLNQPAPGIVYKAF